MALYQYPSGSLIDRVQILTNDTGGHRAYLHAAPGAESDQLRKAKQTMRAAGLKCVPTVHDGKPALEVRGFKKPEALIAQISQLGLAKEIPTVATDAATTAPKSKWRNATLKVAGLSYIIGDAAYIIYATKQYRHEYKPGGGSNNLFNLFHIAAGFGYGIGSVVLAVFGSRDQSQNTIETAAEKIDGYFRKEGDVPEPGSTLEHWIDGKRRSIGASIGHTLAKYPSETLNSVYVGVGGLLSAAAFYKAAKAHSLGNKKEFFTELADVGLGVVTATSAIAGLTIKEKKPVEGERKRGGLVGVWEWIQEKPLRATGIGYMVATLFHAGGTVLKYKAGDSQIRKTALFRGVFVGTNILSEILLTLSSKGHGSGVKPDKSVDETVIAIAAEHLMRHPAEERERMIPQVAGFMASPEVLGIKADQIVTELRGRIALLDKNPWTKHFSAGDGKAFMDRGDAEVAQMTRSSTLADQHAPSTKVSGAQHHSAGLEANDNALKPAMAM